MKPPPANAEEIRRHKILLALQRLYPEARCALNFRNPYELLIATILSAQSTDKTVNQVTPALFTKYATPSALAKADLLEIEKLIYPTGFFRTKARNLLGCAQVLVLQHNGVVPQTMAELTALPGVGRKTANVVLGNAFDINEGIVVDTHVQRLTQRLGLTAYTEPVKIERALMEWVPQRDWTLLSHWLILHGRQICIARKPKCETCTLAHLCPSSQRVH